MQSRRGRGRLRRSDKTIKWFGDKLCNTTLPKVSLGSAYANTTFPRSLSRALSCAASHPNGGSVQKVGSAINCAILRCRKSRSGRRMLIRLSLVRFLASCLNGGSVQKAGSAINCAILRCRKSCLTQLLIQTDVDFI